MLNLIQQRVKEIKEMKIEKNIKEIEAQAKKWFSYEKNV